MKRDGRDTVGPGWLRVWLPATLSGAALALAFPGAGLSLLAFVFPALLLEAISGAGRGRQALFAGWLAGTVQWIVSANWVTPVMHNFGGLPLAVAALCLVAMSVILATTWAAAAWVTWLAKPALRPWVFPAAWIALDALRRLPPYNFPWDPVANAFSSHPVWLGSLPVWGATGLSWAIVAVGAGLWAMTRRSSRRGGALLVGVAVALAVVAGLAAPGAQPEGPPVTVAALQPGTPVALKWDPAAAEKIFENVIRLSGEAAGRGATLIAWPEGAVPYTLERDPTYREIVTDLARQSHAAIVLNSIGTDPGGAYTNSAYLVTANGVSPHRYDKVHLVPFGEYVPFFARFAFTRGLVREVGHFTPGHDVSPLVDGRLRLGMAICFEIVFGDHVAAEVRRGANVIVTISDDGWYGYSWAPHQHFGQAILRAVETRRWVVRAALTGISGFISPEGRVVSTLGVGQKGVLVEKIEPCGGMTPRVRFGDWWLAVCIAGALLGLGFGLRRRRTRMAPGTRPAAGPRSRP
ncbi:MAG: apolipoprotein N-acyltransferase [Acidobacteria bacterium]|nr:apolipoprotein N-acyltransferase [Acidobacteriota bacterium]